MSRCAHLYGGCDCCVTARCYCHTPADPGADECAADAAGEWLADLADSGDTDFNTQNTPEEA